MFSRAVKRLQRDQRGITGLETAIILIAFVVVASVFAYTVLSAGIFSSERGKEAIHSGLQTARGSLELVGSVKATGVVQDTLDAADSAWTAATNVTAATDTTDKKQGTASNGLTVAALFTTGLIASSDLAPTVSITDHYSARLWLKTDINVAANVLRLVIDDTAGCGSPIETINIPALTATNGWTQVQVKLATPASLTAVACVGLDAFSDPGVVVIDVDYVEAPGEVSQLSFFVANALDGEPIDLTTTSDADSDGLLSDEATKTHVLTIDFLDKDQRVNDVTWSSTEIGKGDGDSLLEAGEKFSVTVEMEAMDPMPVSYTELAIVINPELGSSLIIERTLPSPINAVIDLQ